MFCLNRRLGSAFSHCQIFCPDSLTFFVSISFSCFWPGWGKVCSFCTSNLVCLFSSYYPSLLSPSGGEFWAFPFPSPFSKCQQFSGQKPILQQECGVLLLQEAGFSVGIFPDCHPWQELQGRNREKEDQREWLVSNFVVYAFLSSFSLPWSYVCIFGHGSEFLPNEICCKML